MAVSSLTAPALAADQQQVLGWGRSDVRAQEWLDLVQIINTPPVGRTANDQLVYDWIQGAYQQQLETEAQDAVTQYNAWNGNPCAFNPPGGYSGDGDYTYSGNAPYGVCTGFCFDIAGCPPTPPSVNDFTFWGNYEGLKDQLSELAPIQTGDGSLNEDPAISILQSASSTIGVAGSLSAAGVKVPLAQDFGSEASSLGDDPTSLLQPLQNIGGFSALTITDLTALSADLLSEAADAVSIIAGVEGMASTAASVAAAVLLPVDFALAGSEYLLKIIQDNSVLPDLQSAVSSADSTPPDLQSAVGNQSSYVGLYLTFMLQTLPDVNYQSDTCDRYQPCADAPSLSPPSPGWMFQVYDFATGTSQDQSSMYTYDPSGMFLESYVVPQGDWFVSTKYVPNTANEISGVGEKGQPPDPPGGAGAAYQSYQLDFVDGYRNPYMAEVVPAGPHGTPVFAITPLTKNNEAPCAVPNEGYCVTSEIVAMAPDGSEEGISLVPPPAVINVAPSVPTSVTLGQAFTLGAVATAGNMESAPPFTYTWTLEGNTYSGQDQNITLPETPGVFVGGTNIELTVTDTYGNVVREYYPIGVVAPTDSTLVAGVLDPGSPETTSTSIIYGQPVNLWDHLLSTCDNQSSEGANQLCGGNADGGSAPVQFYVDGVPVGSPVYAIYAHSGLNCPPSPEACTGWWAESPVVPADLLGVTASGASHVLTAEYDGSAATSGVTATLDLTVSQATSEMTVQAVLPNGTVYPLGSNLGPSYGQPLTFTAKLYGVPPSDDGSPSGTVQFVVDGTNLGSPVPVINSVATSSSINGLSASPSIAVGHDIEAVYSGDNNYASDTGCLAANNGCVLAVGPTPTSVSVHRRHTRCRAATAHL